MCIRDRYNCDGTCVNDINENGLCDELEVFGCTSESADNYDPEALTDNGTCIWLDGLVESPGYTQLPSLASAVAS